MTSPNVERPGVLYFRGGLFGVMFTGDSLPCSGHGQCCLLHNMEPTEKETEEAIAAIDRLAKLKNITKADIFEKRKRTLESIAYGMVTQGDYHPLHVKAFMIMWRVRNGIDVCMAD